MKRRITISAVMGAIVAVCWIVVMGAVLNLYSPLTPAWNAIMWASCPPIGAVRTAWWVVPILNGLFYAAIAITIEFFRKFIRPFAS